MALTSEQIKQYRQKYGLDTKPTASSTAVMSAQDRINALRAKVTQTNSISSEMPVEEKWIDKPAFDVGSETNVGKGLLKSVANTGKSLLKAGVGIAQTLNPIEILKNIKDYTIGTEDYTKELGGGITGKYKVLGNIAKEAPGAALDLFTPSFIKKGVENKSAKSSIENLAEDPAQLLPYFLLGKKTIETNLPKFDKAISAPGSAIKSGASKLAQPIVEKAKTSAVNSIADNYRELAGQTETMRKTLISSGKQGKDPAQWLAERNIVPKIEKGKVISVDMEGKPTYNFNELSSPLYQQERIFLKAIEPSVKKTNLSEVEQQAIKNVRTDKNINSNIANDLERQIRNEFDNYRTNFGESVTLSDLLGIKEGKWSVTKFDATKPYQGTIDFEIGRAAKDIIENSIPKEYGTVIKDLNKVLGDIYDAKKFYTKLNGKTVKGGRLGGYFAGVVGAGVGTAVPLPGAEILGYIAGRGIADILQSSSISDITKTAILKNIKITQPEVYNIIVRYIGDIKARQLDTLRLTAPSSIQLSDKYQSMPNKGSSMIVSEAKKTFGKDPETGKYKRVYTSEPK